MIYQCLTRTAYQIADLQKKYTPTTKNDDEIYLSRILKKYYKLLCNDFQLLNEFMKSFHLLK